jgi:hypothetical protein
MKTKETQATPGLASHQKLDEDLSRRKFLQTAVAISTVAATIPITGIAQTGSTEHGLKREDPMETILKRYGSEFGDLDQIG